MTRMDCYGFNKAIANSAKEVSYIAEQIEETKRIELEEKQRKNIQDRENHDNLGYLAQNSLETINVLKEMNQVLKNHVELLEKERDGLENHLTDIYKVLSEVLETDIQNGEEQRELLQQANALACEISSTLDRGEKINWKDKTADGGVQVVISALGILMKMKGILT